MVHFNQLLKVLCLQNGKKKIKEKPLESLRVVNFWDINQVT